MQLFSADATMFFFLNFKLFFDLENIKKTPQKVAYLWQLGGIFLCSPDCPKQPRTSFPCYKFFYTIVSAKVSDSFGFTRMFSIYILGVFQRIKSFVQKS